MLKKKILIIGIGNEFRSDDAAGLLAARKLKKISSPSIKVIEHNGDGASLIEEWKNYDNVIIVDAFCYGKKPGTEYIIDVNKERIPAEKMHHSSHIYGLSDAVGTARVLHKLPRNLKIYGIEGKSFTAGTSVSSEIQNALTEVTEKIIKDIKC